jgi:Zn-dependent protease
MDINIPALTTWVLPILLAITLHEAAHAYAADRLGDDTARRQGRVSMNPLNHVDPVGTVLLPAVQLLLSGRIWFGWAKPVPVAFWRLRVPRRDMMIVAAAGPAANILLALIAALLAHALPYVPDFAGEWLRDSLINMLRLNATLAVFNLLPIPPLDGGRILVGLLPQGLAGPFARLEPIGIPLVLVLFLVVPMLGEPLGLDLNLGYWLVYEPAMAIARIVLRVAGLW